MEVLARRAARRGLHRLSIGLLLIAKFVPGLEVLARAERAPATPAMGGSWICAVGFAFFGLLLAALEVGRVRAIGLRYVFLAFRRGCCDSSCNDESLRTSGDADERPTS